MQEELGWYSTSMSRAILMLLAHARRCGVSQRDFFREIRREVQRMSEYSSTLPDVEIEMRARRIALSTTKELLDGPQSVELATLEWVAWFNHHRLMEPLGYIPPAEAEANYYRQLETVATEPAST